MSNQKLWVGAALVSLPLIVGGLALASANKPTDHQAPQVAEKGYICPATGEDLPCPNCCPLKKAN